MGSICIIPKELSTKFLEAIKNGSLDMNKLADMKDSKSRIAALEKVVGKDYAERVNTRFEKGFLSKDQQTGLIKAIKDILGNESKITKSYIDKISKMNRLLSPKEEEGFLASATKDKLGIGVSESEAKTIYELAKKIESLNMEDKDVVKNLQDLIDASDNILNLTPEQKADIESIRIELNRVETPEEISQQIRIKINEGDEDIGLQVQELTRSFIVEGITDPEKLVDAVYNVLKESIPEITRRETMDAISGYGKFKQLSKDEIDVKLRDLKGQMQNLGKLEDMQAGQAPLKSGVERPKMSDEQRRLVQQVNEAKKKGGFDVKDSETQLRTALETVKTRLKNQIKDLEHQIKTREKTIKEKGVAPSDAETIKLKERVDELKVEFNEIFGEKALTNEQRISLANKALDRAILNLESDLKEGKLYPQKKVSETVSTPEIESKRARLEALKVQRQELRDIENPKMSPEEKALQSYKTRTTAQIEKLTEQLKTGDFSTITKKQKERTFDNEALNLKADLENIQSIIKGIKDTERARINEFKKSGLGKTEKLFNKIFEKNIPPELQEKITLAKEAQSIPEDSPDFSPERMAYGRSLVRLQKYADELKNPTIPLSAKEIVVDKITNPSEIILDIANTAKAGVTTLDNSLFGRQGIKLLFTPFTGGSKIWITEFVKSFKGIAKQLAAKQEGKGIFAKLGDPVMDEIKAGIVSSRNSLNGKYAAAKNGYGLNVVGEEVFPEQPILERIPLLGRLFKASEVSFNSGALMMRKKLADAEIARAERNGIDVLNKEEASGLGELIGNMTGRGEIELARKGIFSAKVVNAFLFSIKFLTSNFETLISPVRYATAKARSIVHGVDEPGLYAKKRSAQNLAQIVTSVAAIATIANTLSPGSFETNPDSTNFGKLKINGIYHDITGGMGSIVVLASRMIPDKDGKYWFISSTGKKTEMFKGYKPTTILTLVEDFIEGKVSPAAGVFRDLANGQDYQGRKPTPATILAGQQPFSLQLAEKLKDRDFADNLLTLILDGSGFGASVPQKSTTKSTKLPGN